MSKRIKATLSQSSIQQAIREIEQYKQEMLTKCRTVAERLCGVGIQIATENAGGYGKYITFYRELIPEKSGVKAVMVATNTGLIKSEWRTQDGEKSVDISPLLMAEFGSGLRANNPNASKFGMGTGTFPGQTHAEDPEGWWYMDLEGNWHHSFGVTPTMPMFKAAQEMSKNISRVVKEVFSS